MTEVVLKGSPKYQLLVSQGIRPEDVYTIVDSVMSAPPATLPNEERLAMHAPNESPSPSPERNEHSFRRAVRFSCDHGDCPSVKRGGSIMSPEPASPAGSSMDDSAPVVHGLEQPPASGKVSAVHFARYAAFVQRFLFSLPQLFRGYELSSAVPSLSEFAASSPGAHISNAELGCTAALDDDLGMILKAMEDVAEPLENAGGGEGCVPTSAERLQRLKDIVTQPFKVLGELGIMAFFFHTFLKRASVGNSRAALLAFVTGVIIIAWVLARHVWRETQQWSRSAIIRGLGQLAVVSLRVRQAVALLTEMELVGSGRSLSAAARVALASLPGVQQRLLIMDREVVAFRRVVTHTLHSLGEENSAGASSAALVPAGTTRDLEVVQEGLNGLHREASALHVTFGKFSADIVELAECCSSTNVENPAATPAQPTWQPRWFQATRAQLGLLQVAIHYEETLRERWEALLQASVRVLPDSTRGGGGGSGAAAMGSLDDEAPATTTTLAATTRYEMVRQMALEIHAKICLLAAGKSCVAPPEVGQHIRRLAVAWTAASAAAPLVGTQHPAGISAPATELSSPQFDSEAAEPSGGQSAAPATDEVLVADGTDFPLHSAAGEREPRDRFRLPPLPAGRKAMLPPPITDEVTHRVDEASTSGSSGLHHTIAVGDEVACGGNRAIMFSELKDKLVLRTRAAENL